MSTTSLVPVFLAIPSRHLVLLPLSSRPVATVIIVLCLALSYLLIVIGEASDMEEFEVQKCCKFVSNSESHDLSVVLLLTT